MKLRVISIGILSAAILLTTLNRSLAREQPSYRLGWLMWWETNRDLYLAKAMEKRKPVPAPASTQPLRGRAVEALLHIAKEAKDTELRQDAVLALGRMHDPELLPNLIEFTRDGNIAPIAIISVGLIGNKDATTFLLSEKRSGRAAHATIAALALVDRPDVAVLDALVDAAGATEDPEARRLAVWGIRVQGKSFKAQDQADPKQANKVRSPRPVLLDILQKSPNATLAAEAALALGAVGTSDDAELLGVIAADTRQAAQVPAAWRTAAKQYPGNTIEERREHPVLRVSAALGLVRLHGSTRLRDGSDALTPLAFPLADWPNGFRNALGMIAIAQANDAGGMGLVTNFIGQGQQPGLLRNQQPMTGVSLDRQRGFAAIALALSGRSQDDFAPAHVELMQAQVANPNQNTSTILANILRGQNETDDLRAACALGLGLTDDSGNAQVLIDAARTINPQNKMVWGYTMLGLALLNNPAAIEGAEKILKPPAKQFDATSLLHNGGGAEDQLPALLGERAAVLSIGLLGDARAIPLLRGQWGANPSLDLETARALAWCGDYDITDTLIQILSQDTHNELRRSAAITLGELFDHDRPSRLSRLLAGSNCSSQYHDSLPPYNLRSFPLPTPYFHQLANPFLFLRLLPIAPVWE